MARAIEVPVVAKKGTLARSIEGEAATAFRNLGRSSGAVAPLGRMLGKIRADADEFTKSIEASNARVIAFGASVGVINGISNAFKELVRVTVNVEKSLTDINVVLNANQSQLTKFGDGLFKVAKNTAQSFEVVAEAATEFARQGLSIEETLKRTNDALILTRLTGLKAAESVKGLTAATNGFAKAGLNTTQIINKLAAVDVKFAVSADDLIAALSRTGAVAQEAGLSMDELIGMVTAAQQVTARGGPVIGNAFKTIFTRVQRPKTLETLRDLKIAVDDASGASLGARKILENLAKSYDGLSSAAKDAVNQQVAGVFQINILKAAVGDLQKENSIAARATAVSASATDQATKKNEMLNQTIAALSTQTGIALTELAKKIGDIAIAPGMRDLIGSFKALVEGTTGILDGEGTGSGFARGLLKGIGNVLTGPGLIVIGGVFIKLFKDLTVFGVNSLKNLLGLNNAAKQQAALQKGIGTLLQTNTAYQTQMAAAAGNVNKQAAITQRFLQQEIAMRQQAAALTGVMAHGAFVGGFRVDKGGDITKKRKGKLPSFAPTEVPNFAPWSMFGKVFNRVASQPGMRHLHGYRGEINRMQGHAHELAAQGIRASASSFNIRGQGAGADISSGPFAGFDFKPKPMFKVGGGDMKQFERHVRQGGQAAVPMGSFFRRELTSPKGRSAAVSQLKEGPYSYRQKGEDLTAIGTAVNMPAIMRDWHRRTAKKLGVRYPGTLTEEFLTDLYSHPGMGAYIKSASSKRSWAAATNVEGSKAARRLPALQRHFGPGAVYSPNMAPIGDAIKREKHQVGGLLGINPSQVKTKVIQNTALRSSFNPGGFGVISPTIGQNNFADARRMHKGEDLRTANLPNFALDVPGIDPLGGRKALSLTSTGYTRAIETVIAGIKPDAARDIGAGTARALGGGSAGAGKIPMPAPLPRGLSASAITSGTPARITDLSPELQKAGGGMANFAMNAFFAYSMAEMASGFAPEIAKLSGGKLTEQQASGALKGAVVGGFAGRAAGKMVGKPIGKLAGKALSKIPQLRGAGPVVEFLTTQLATAGGAALGGNMGAGGMKPILEFMLGARDSLDVAAANQMPGAQAMAGAFPDATTLRKGIEDIDAEELFASQIRPRAALAEESLARRRVTTRIAAAQDARGIFRDQSILTRAGRLGFDDPGALARRQSALNMRRLNAAQRSQTGAFVSDTGGQLLRTLGKLPSNIGGGMMGLRLQNIIRGNITRGNISEVGDFFKAIKGGDVTASGGVPTAFDALQRLGDLMPESERNAGVGGGGFDAERTMEAIKSLREGYGNLADAFIDAGDAKRDMDQKFLDDRSMEELKNSMNELNASMQRVDRFTGSFASSFASAFSNITSGASSAKEAMMDFGISVFGAINKIQSERIAADLTGMLFPQGGKAEGFLSKLFGGGGKQIGGLIKAQNGMYISGGRTGDKNPALLEDGEYVLNRNAVKAMGGPGALDALNFNMAPRFAEGGGFMSGLGSILMAPFNLIGSLFQGIFGGSGGRKRGTAMSGTGTSMQSRRAAATDRGLAETNKMLAQLDAISGRRGGAGSIPSDSAMMSGIRKRAARSKQLKHMESAIKNYAGINPGAVGLEGIYSQDQAGVFSFGGGRPTPMGTTAVIDVLNDAKDIALNKGAGAGLVYLEQFYRTNPRAFDRLSGFPHGQNFSQKEGFFMDMFRSLGVTEFASGGRLGSPISRSGVKSSALESIIKDNEFLPPVAGMGSALGGGGASVRLGISDPRLSGFAHANDPILQNVRGDIQNYHQKQREKKFAAQAKKDQLVKTIVQAAVSTVVAQGVGAVKGAFSKGSAPLTPDQFDAIENPNTPTYNPADAPSNYGGVTSISSTPGASDAGAAAAQQMLRNQGTGMQGPGSARPRPGSIGGLTPVQVGEKILYTDAQGELYQKLPSGGFQPIPKQQRGGHIDNIPAMLTGGEFVVNPSTVRRHGSAFFSKLNRGGRVGYQTGGIVGDQQFVPAQGDTQNNNKTETSNNNATSNTTVNITVNSGTGEASVDGGNAGTEDREMATRLRDAVLSVLKQEKRTGGMLRDVTSNDQ